MLDVQSMGVTSHNFHSIQSNQNHSIQYSQNSAP